MSIGLIALLDDVAAIAKVAAASLDDVAGQAMRAGVKSAGLVIDDAAVTPRYMVGFAPSRELPIIAKIARGSLRNKLLYLLPIALALAAFAPWAVTPLLMLGGAYLSYEGAEKIHEAFFARGAHKSEDATGAQPADPKALERRKVTGAIRTDFILSAEIMAVSLGSIPDAGFWASAAILALVSVALTALVYGGVALIVKADDIGLALAKHGRTGFGRAIGRALVKSMPGFLRLLAIVGTAAMLWVGGGIVLHGVEEFGFGAALHFIEGVSHAAGAVVPVGQGAVAWIIGAFGSGVVGLALGYVLVAVMEGVVAPVSRVLAR